MRRKQRRRGARRAAAALEMALILPLLVTIVLGCVDFGRFAYMYISVTNAARAGAGLASFNPVTPSSQAIWEAKIAEAVQDEMKNQAHYDANDLTVLTPTVTTEGTNLKRVRVEVHYEVHTIVAWPLLPTELTLARAVSMRFIR
jgi:Flp pilus assembly protein TadG